MAWPIGSIVGGLLIVYLLSKLIEWLIISRIMNDAKAGLFVSVGLGVVGAVVLYGFGNADGGPWNPLPGGIAYVLAGPVVAILRLVAFNRWAARKAEEEALDEVFE